MSPLSNCIYETFDCNDKDSFRFPCERISLDEKETSRYMKILSEVAMSTEPVVRYEFFKAFTASNAKISCTVGFICIEPGTKIVVTVTDKYYAKNERHYDRLTGLYNIKAFCDELDKVMSKSAESEFIYVIYFDIQRFKAVNDMFGMVSGDELLIHTADCIREVVSGNGKACRIGSDRFVFFIKSSCVDLYEMINNLFEKIADFEIAFEIICNAGIYIAGKEEIKGDSAVDRAIMAQTKIKGSYTVRCNIYTEDIRKSLLTEQEITGLMSQALENGEFKIYYQPQYNHSTGMLTGAEALVRWAHPEKGLISPGVFIPVFEKNGFITKLDMYVFEQVCRFLRKCIDNNLHIVPISSNLTRYDIFCQGFIENLEEIRKKYDVPSKYLRIEITESAALGNSEFINDAVRRLHNFGYIVEMDDFGSGYSSLNILKDIDFDVIKLDMKFLEKENNSESKGGTILSSVVRMINWLGLPIIAEGVETINQADFLLSIGSEYIQGYLYSKPLSEEKYIELLSGSSIGAIVPHMKLVDELNADNFWSYDSVETLIFNNFVGGAGIFCFKDDKTEILRVNKKFLNELNMNLSEKDIISSNILDFIENEDDKKKYLEMLYKAEKTKEEQECETWQTIKSDCCGQEVLCIRTVARMIGKAKDRALFHIMIRNITAEKNRIDSILDSERRFKAASEQVNIYYWEYSILTHEMRPCFRCMRDLGMPPLVTNYPESAIEMGIFPPEVADSYREFMKKIDSGVPSLEAIYPLTENRIPFHVRYTTEYDENGNPIKAYASAALVVD